MTSLNRLARGAAIALASFAAGGASAQEHTFTLHHFLSELAPAHTGMLVPWAERVMQNADGRVAIEIFPSMTLGGRPPELIAQARDGVADIVWTVNGYTPGLFPRSEVFELPTIFVNDPTSVNLAMRDMFDEHLAEENPGVMVLFMHVHTGNALHTADREVRTPADTQGMTIRTPSRTGAWVIEALGADPVAMPVPELPQAMARGVVEAALIPWEVAAPLRLQEQTQYQIEGHDKTRLGTTVFQVSMNLDRWEALPEDIQQAFLEASDEDWLAEVGRIWRDNDDAGIEFITAAGNTHVVLSEEETQAFLDTLAPVVNRWVEDVSAEGVDGAALVEAARAAIDAHSTGQ
jgi:TRAP-type C4-dicarboxylate transport system substrate-binding protein